MCSKWVKYELPVSHVSQCHLLDYEHQIVSIVLSHCLYSLKVGEAHSVQYDHQALEKHIVDKFFHGKPRILTGTPEVMYCEDVYTAQKFRSIRSNVKPQVSIAFG